MTRKGIPWQDRLVEDRDTGCWLWTGAVGDFGHGQITISYKRYKVHRLAWEEEYGPIPEGMQVCHHCDVPACCNPRHLFLGTQLDNIRDCMNKGRFKSRAYHNTQKTHCPKGHAYDAENTLMFKGKRHCRECMRIYARGYKKKQRESRPERPERPPQTHCKHGHELTPENVYTCPRGLRNCKECQRIRTRAWQRSNGQLRALV
jgi:hypothetical protein